MKYFYQYIINEKKKEFELTTYLNLLISTLFLLLYCLFSYELILTKIINCLFMSVLGVFVFWYFFLLLLYFYKNKKRLLYEIISIFYLAGSFMILFSLFNLIRKEGLMNSIFLIPFLQIFIISIFNRSFIWKINHFNIITIYKSDRNNKKNSKIML